MCYTCVQLQMAYISVHVCIIRSSHTCCPPYTGWGVHGEVLRVQQLVSFAEIACNLESG